MVRQMTNWREKGSCGGMTDVTYYGGKKLDAVRDDRCGMRQTHQYRGIIIIFNGFPAIE